MDRRDFLKWTGLGVAGACAVPLASAVAGAVGERTEPDAKALGGRRWAMLVDTRKCLEHEGCDACTRACHQAHNVPSMAEPRHDLKWIWKEPFAHVFPEQTDPYMSEARRARPMLVMCNHCDNPPCVRVCPTQATWRRADGLVMMDEHRCIGCRYCVVACPYGSRSFNWVDPRLHLASVSPGYPTRTKGVVEKCTFCAERLAVGELPLCVEACTRAGVGALSFGDLGNASSPIAGLLGSTNALRRKSALGTSPHVFYVI